MENKAIIEGALSSPSQISLGGVMGIPAVRQVLLLVGVAASVAAGFAIVQWSQAPGMTQLYRDLDTADAAQVAEALRGAGIKYELDTGSGVVLVAESRLHDARLEMASQGLPQGAAMGMELIQEQSSFGVSQFMEGARYQHALEAELARTITHIGAVREARVHLALPKQSAFIRDQKSASASVLLQLARGRELESDQAAAIVNLVASSIPNLAAADITLIDQHGRLLSSPGSEAVDAQAASQFRHARKLEETYRRRVEELLTPLVGPGRVRAQVVASLDFTVTEETRETFDPINSAVRSEHISEEGRRGSGLVPGGIPGALSNQPPQATEGAPGTAIEGEPIEAINTSRVSTRNFEVDRTISRVRPQPGTIEKLSVAVLVDNSSTDDTADVAIEDATQSALSQGDLERYTALVKEAVGFNAVRGDTVVVMNAAFRDMPEPATVVTPKLWEQPLIREYLKQVLGAALVLVLAFGLVRPLLKNLVAAAPAGGAYAGGGQALLVGGAQQQAAGQRALAGPSYDDKVKAARNVVAHDPARVAQLVRKWVSANE